MQRMRRVHEDEQVVVLVPADPARPSGRDVFVYDTFEQDGRDQDAALGRAIRERADALYYGPINGAQSNFDDVGDFHEKFGLGNVTHGTVGIVGMPADLLEFRLKFLNEELREFKEAMEAGDEAKAFDALLDLAYVTFGTAHLLGYPWQEGWNLVQAANMAKVRAESAEHSAQSTGRGHASDVVKPEGWQPPDIEGLLASHGWPS